MSTAPAVGASRTRDFEPRDQLACGCPRPFARLHSSLHFFDPHVAIPDRLAFVLEADVALRRAVLDGGLVEVQVVNLLVVQSTFRRFPWQVIT